MHYRRFFAKGLLLAEIKTATTDLWSKFNAMSTDRCCGYTIRANYKFTANSRAGDLNDTGTEIFSKPHASAREYDTSYQKVTSTHAAAGVCRSSCVHHVTVYSINTSLYYTIAMISQNTLLSRRYRSISKRIVWNRERKILSVIYALIDVIVNNNDDNIKNVCEDRLNV